jgi:hypothetical protein
MAIRRRRIVRRAVMVLAVVVLLPIWYIGSVGFVVYLAGASLLPKGAQTHPCWHLMRPALWYVNHPELPGSEMCRRYLQWCENFDTEHHHHP